MAQTQIHWVVWSSFQKAAVRLQTSRLRQQVSLVGANTSRDGMYLSQFEFGPAVAKLVLKLVEHLSFDYVSRHVSPFSQNRSDNKLHKGHQNTSEEKNTTPHKNKPIRRPSCSLRARRTPYTLEGEHNSKPGLKKKVWCHVSPAAAKLLSDTLVAFPQ